MQIKTYDYYRKNMFRDPKEIQCSFCQEPARKILEQKTKTSRTVSMNLCFHHARFAAYVLTACGSTKNTFISDI